MRYLAIDIGGKRTGFAFSDASVVALVQPLKVIEHANEHAMIEAIAKVIESHAPDELVIGLPLNMDDTEGPAAKQARAHAVTVGERFGLPVHLQDERLTSFEADNRMSQSGRTHLEKKRLRDAIAAATLLEDYLASVK